MANSVDILFRSRKEVNEWRIDNLPGINSQLYKEKPGMSTGNFASG